MSAPVHSVEIEGHKFDLTIRRIANRLDRVANQWDSNARHFQVELSRQGYGDIFTFYYSQGSAVKEEPQPLDVLLCIVDDAIAGDMQMSEFTREYGYSYDAPLALAAWKESGEYPDDLEEFCYTYYSVEEYHAITVYQACQEATGAFINMGIANDDLDDLHAHLLEIAENS